MSENPHVGACGGNLYDEKFKPATSFTRFMPSILSDIDYFFYNIYYYSNFFGNNVGHVCCDNETS